nr:retrovirus-related Pol polyprotein from transposon TNT 1-94 [Tanacetum cinerariifolium]
SCVACKKGKQHKASCKSKTFSSVDQPLFRLHMDLFGPTFVKSLSKRSYCLVITDDYSRFSWVFFLASKDDTTPVLKTFIIGLENLLSLKAEAVNTACYVQNRVLVTKPHNKTPYELLHGRLPSIGFMRHFGCPITILNTLDPLGKFQRKVDEGFLVGYSMCSKAFRVFNSRTHIVQETLHVNFMETKPNVAVSSPAWKQGDKIENKDKGKSPVVIIIGFMDLNAEFEECNNNNSNGVNAASSLVSTAWHNFLNSTNEFSAVGPSNVAASPTAANSSSQDASTSTHNLDMPNLEDLTQSDNANDVEEPKRVHQALKDPSWIEAMQEELFQFKMQKV